MCQNMPKLFGLEAVTIRLEAIALSLQPSLLQLATIAPSVEKTE